MSNPLQPSWLTKVSEFGDPVWPAGAKRNKFGELEINGVGSSELVRKFGSPLYVVDQAEFESRLSSVKTAFETAAKNAGTSVKLYYASKALLTADVARWAASAGYSIDVSTGGELAVVLAAGVPGSQIGLHGNNKSLVEIGRAVSSDVSAIVIDSEIEIERIAAAAGAQDKIQPVRLRVNTGVHAHTHEYLATAREDQKFGIAISDVPSLVEKIRSHSHLKFLGLHCHIGSQIFAVDGFIASAERMLELHARLSAKETIPELNLGGGFGIAYIEGDRPLSIDEMADQIVKAVKKKCDELSIPVPKLAFEPGRIIAGPAGITLYTVGTTKEVLVTEDGPGASRKYVSVDGGMSDNSRPALYEAEYSATLASRPVEGPAALSRVVGKHCESGDIVVKNALLPEDIGVNDLLAVAATGAYCYSLSSNYNYLPRPAMVAVKDGKAQLLIRAETEQDLLSKDMGLEG
ncbi:MAG: diaminopimelate decarboxylase [Actinomycetota bacterium]|jgi:diaminopimelate decarboxylase